MQVNQSSFAYRANLTAATLADRKVAQFAAQSRDMRLSQAARAEAAKHAQAARETAAQARAETDHMDSHGYGKIRRLDIAA